MSDARRDLVAAHRPELLARVADLGRHVEDVGADAACAERAHALRGAALTLGLDALAVAAVALEAACDADGGDPPSALRAVAAGRRALEVDVSHEARLRHDLRGALNIVVGHASLLELEPLTPKQRESVAEILAAADAMTALLGGAEAPPRPGASCPPGATEAFASCRVLVVEDDQVTAEVVRRLLGELGADVLVCRDAADAVAVASTETPDLVLLDLRLGDADGRDLLTALRSTPGLAGTPVVVSSGESSAALGRELAALGATAVLPKPVTLDALRALLADVRS